MPPDSRRDAASFDDIENARRSILAFTEGINAEEFEQDLKTQSSVMHQLLIIGEAAKRVSEEARSTCPDIPWREMAGMRDRLIHGYHEVDLQEVWGTVVRDIPFLLEVLTRSER